MSPRRALGLGLALGAAIPFAGIGAVAGALLAATQPPFAEILGVTRWMVHPWLSLAGAAAALWPAAAGATALLILALRAAGLRPSLAAALAAALSWAGLTLGMTVTIIGSAGGTYAASVATDWAVMFAPVIALAAIAMDLGPRLLARLGRLDEAAGRRYPGPAKRGRMP